MAAICVYCASSQSAPPEYVELAALVGAEIARRGHSLVSGGGSISAMGAVARAARAGGAHTTGVIPELLLKLEVGDIEADDLVVVDDMRIRKGEMERRSDAFIALPGGIGTLEELVEIWVGSVLGFHTKPLVVVDPDDHYAGLRLQATTMVQRGLVRQAAVDRLVWARSAEEALDSVETLLAALPLAHPDAEELLEAEP
ncbi:MAG TPA: TIGR00730 family Rossman fold protein [Mycobacteriales bacterium]|nr:TIGR00730 family Rossman fold protein [Mycobacteriales bacterium]